MKMLTQFWGRFCSADSSLNHLNQNTSGGIFCKNVYLSSDCYALISEKV